MTKAEKKKIRDYIASEWPDARNVRFMSTGRVTGFFSPIPNTDCIGTATIGLTDDLLIAANRYEAAKGENDE